MPGSRDTRTVLAQWSIPDRPVPRLRELTKDAGLRQIDIAAFLRRDQTTIGRYERGATPIPSDLLFLLCRRFEVTAEYLLGWDRVNGTSHDETEAA